MRDGTGSRGRDLPPLLAGGKLAGLELRTMVHRDAFSSLWRVDPLHHGFPDACIRAIPLRQLSAPDATERFSAELAFWETFPGSRAVELYDSGEEGGYLFMVMRYLAEGSAENLPPDDAWVGDRLADFAVDLAAAVRDVHSSAGAHGNLKPSNVFPLSDGGVLLSDFTMSLWLDECDAGCAALESHVRHPYRSPEQRGDPRDFDTRSDVYTYAMVLMRAMTGMTPAPDGSPPDTTTRHWPGWLVKVLERCLERDPVARPADGFELVDLLRSSLESGPRKLQDSALLTPAVPQKLSRREVLDRVEQAHGLIREGELEEAVSLLEALPSWADGVADLAEQIEGRQRACETLIQEAARLGGMGQTDAALEMIAQAEAMWRSSQAVRTAKANLVAAAGEERRAPDGLPSQLARALADERYEVARPMIEALIREGDLTQEAREAILRFKTGRVRRAFLEKVRNGRRLYILGHRQEAKEQWLEAGKWLPHGSDRDRLRQIAESAGRGTLRVVMDYDEASALGTAGGRAFMPTSKEGRRRVRLLAIACILGLLVLYLIVRGLI